MNIPVLSSLLSSLPPSLGCVSVNGTCLPDWSLAPLAVIVSAVGLPIMIIIVHYANKLSDFFPILPFLEPSSFSERLQREERLRVRRRQESLVALFCCVFGPPAIGVVAGTVTLIAGMRHALLADTISGGVVLLVTLIVLVILLLIMPQYALPVIIIIASTFVALFGLISTSMVAEIVGAVGFLIGLFWAAWIVRHRQSLA